MEQTTKKIKLKNIRKIYSENDIYSINSIYLILYDESLLEPVFKGGKLKTWWIENKDKEIKFPLDPLPLLSRVNNMVKHSEFPKRLRGRFYDRKRRFIILKAKLGEVDEIYKEEDCYNFIISGYSFHQPIENVKYQLPNLIIDGEREYDRNFRREQAEINMDEYKTCMLYLMYLTKNYAKQKVIRNPESK